MSLEGTSVKTNICLVTISYGVPATVRRLTNANSDVPTIQGKFFSNPAMEIVLPANSMLDFSEEVAKITFDTSDWLFGQQMSSGRAFPITTVAISEKLENKGEDKTIKRFQGTARSAIKNPSGRSNLLQLVIRSDKARLDFPLGFQANATCGWEYGSAACGDDISLRRKQGTIEWVDNSSRVVTINGLGDLPDSGDYWKHGKVVYLGQAILIRDWSRAAATSFTLAKLPPIDWNGQTVDVFPGCSKHTTDCAFYGRLDEAFSGIGLRSNDYNPLFETN